MLHILLVEDSSSDAGLIKEALSDLDEQLEITHVEQLGEAEGYLTRAGPVDVILLDLGLPDSMGLATVEGANRAAPHVPIIVLTGLDDEAIAIDAVRMGAQDYQVKSEIRPRTLMRAIHHAIERKQAEQERERLLKAIEVERCRMTDIFMRSPAFMVLFRGRQHIVERANEEYFRLVGRRDILGKTLHAALPEIEGQGYFEILDGVYRAGEPFVGQGMRVRLRRTGARQMEERCIDFLCQPMREDDGSISGIFVHGVDVTERRRAEEASERERRTLKHLLQASDHERQSIAYEIHDGLAQYLAGAIMHFQAYSHLKDTEPQAATKAYDAGMTMLQQSRAETRRLISGVRPPILDESGIVNAIAHLLGEQRQQEGPKIEFVCQVEFGRLPPILENAVYRIVQEALTNACRHSRSKNVRLELAQHGDQLHVEIRDWGIGFIVKDVDDGRFGLEGIRQRVRLLGGSAIIDSTPGKGTCIAVELPIVLSKGCGRSGSPPKSLAPK